MKIFGENWEWLLVTISIIVMCWAGVIFFFLVPEPDLIGIHIGDDGHVCTVDQIVKPSINTDY